MNAPTASNEMPGMKSLKANWGWFLAIGIILVVLGAVVIGTPTATVITTVVVVRVIGALLLLGGALQTVHAFLARRWGGFLVHLVSGLLYIVFGWLLLTRPDVSAEFLTILIAAFLLTGGLFRIVIAVQTRGENWFWLVLSGIINILLGLLIWEGWPEISAIVIGLFVGIEMIVNGASWIMVAIGIRSMPDEPGTGTHIGTHMR